MAKTITINLPVKNLDASVKFYEAIGFTKSPDFADEQSIGLTWSDTIFVMLHDHDRWREFTNASVPTPTRQTVIFALSFESRQAVIAMIDKVASIGAQTDINPIIDEEFMYNRSWADPDGHVWEAVTLKV